MASTHKSLRSSTASKRPTTSIADGQIALNTNAASPGLFFKDSAGTDIIKVGPVHVGTTAPNATPAVGGSSGNSTGEVWLDTSLTPVGVKIWSGSAWVNATPTGSTTVQGLLELATNAETQTGSDTARAVTPAGLQSKVSDSTSTTSSTTIASSTAVKSAYDLANAALPKTGGVVTGALEIGTTGSLVFEGATDDGFETTLAVTDPSADRIITLPDRTGTVITNADTGTVTSTMIADGTIVNADVNASAAIAGTKISPNFGAQTLVVDTNVLYVNPTTDRVGIGTTSPAVTTHISSFSAEVLRLEHASTPYQSFYLGLNRGAYILSNTSYLEIAAESASNNTIMFATSGAEKARLDSSGRLLVGTSSTFKTANVSNTYKFGLESTGTYVAAALRTNTANQFGAYLVFSKSRGTANNADTIVAANDILGQISFEGTDGSNPVKGAAISAEVDGTPGLNDMPGRLSFLTTADGSSTPTERMRINSAGNVGIGTTAPDGLLTVRPSSGNSQVFIRTNDTTSRSQLIFGDSADSNVGGVQYDHTNDSLEFHVGNVGEKVRIDSSGRLLVGTSTARAVGGESDPRLQIEGSGATSNSWINLTRFSNSTGAPFIQFGKSRSNTPGTYTVVQDGDTLGGIAFAGADGTDLANYGAKITAEVDGTPGANDMPGRLVFSTTADGASSPTERMRIDSSGNVGVGTTSPSAQLHVRDSANYNFTVAAGNATTGMQIGNYDATDGYNPLTIRGSQFLFTSTGGNELARIDSSGRVGIGTTSPNQKLHLAESGATDLYQRFQNSNGDCYIGLLADGNTVISADTTGDQIIFKAEALERVRIDNSGRLLVGTSSTSGIFRTIIQGNSSTPTSEGVMMIARGSNNPGANGGIGFLDFGDSSHGTAAGIGVYNDGTWTSGSSQPTRMVFTTTASGASSPTEHLAIMSDGLHHFFGATAGLVSRLTAAASTGDYFIAGVHSATAPQTGGTVSFRVWSNGDVVNTNNSYGAISDVKLKENIVDASSQWNDLKTIQVRNYNFKEGQTHTQIGVVAQEVELVSPGLVSESPDRDDEGNDLGTTTKSVNYSVLYMKAVKALQEAMERIETLEAKVAVLEGN